MKRIIISLLIFAPVFAIAYTNPGKPTGYVSDFAQMLRPDTVSVLNNSIQTFEASTTAEIAVVTIPTLNGDTIENYAVKLFEEWGIGKKSKDNGILLLIARDEREMRIEVGYGLEPIIVDTEAAHIIRDVLTPSFKNGKYDEGVTAAVTRMMKDIENGEPMDPTPIDSGKTIHLGGNLIYLVFFLIIWLGSILGRSKSWWAGGIIGAVIGLIIGGLVAIIGLALFGLLFDFLVSRAYSKHKDGGPRPPWFLGGGMGGGGLGGGGGFGGFGGGMSGGGGASGKW